MVELTHQRSIEEFREQCEIRFVADERTCEKFDLLHKFVHRAHAAHLPLHGAQENDGLAGSNHRGLRSIEKVVPLHDHGVSARGFILGQLASDDAAYVKIVRELKTQDGVAKFALTHQL